MKTARESKTVLRNIKVPRPCEVHAGRWILRTTDGQSFRLDITDEQRPGFPASGTLRSEHGALLRTITPESLMIAYIDPKGDGYITEGLKVSTEGLARFDVETTCTLLALIEPDRRWRAAGPVELRVVRIGETMTLYRVATIQYRAAVRARDKLSRSGEGVDVTWARCVELRDELLGLGLTDEQITLGEALHRVQGLRTWGLVEALEAITR